MKKSNEIGLVVANEDPRKTRSKEKRQLRSLFSWLSDAPFELYESAEKKKPPLQNIFEVQLENYAKEGESPVKTHIVIRRTYINRF